ncbi:MAG: FHA domain-containing protein [Steroidobacteraceae bacterium]
MEKRDGENGDDDGIVAEDVTQLVEHIELTGQYRLYEAHDWERATPAADLDDAPILIGEIPEDPELDSMGVEEEDLELFTETHADLNQLLPPGERRANQAAAISAERARWQQRIDALQQSLAERDQRLAEQARLIEELSARLATRTLEREGLAAELRDENAARLAEVAGPLVEESPQAAAPAVEPATDVEYTAELPALDPARDSPVVAPQLAPRLRRYLIGIDLVGCVHELSSHRINIGRTRDNDLRIIDPTVSRLHAMLTVRNGEAMVVDANSRNGIFINGIQVRYARLEDGDMLTFGTVRFRYRVGSDVAGGAFGSA